MKFQNYVGKFQARPQGGGRSAETENVRSSYERISLQHHAQLTSLKVPSKLNKVLSLFIKVFKNAGYH